MRATTTEANYYSCGIATQNLISFASYTKLKIEVSTNANSDSELMLSIHNPVSNYELTNKIASQLITQTATSQVFELDISNYQSSYEVAILSIRSTFAYIYKVWLE